MIQSTTQNRTSSFYSFLTILMLGIGFTSCDTIELKAPILTNSNSEKSKLEYRYWIKYGLKNEPIEAYEIARLKAESSGYTGEWLVKNDNESFNIRFKATDIKAHYIVQRTDAQTKTINISIAVLNSQSKCTIYQPIIRNIKNSPYLKPLEGHYTINDDQGDNIIFDEIACYQQSDAIVTFMNSLDLETDFIGSFSIYHGTNDALLAKSIWQKKARQQAEAQEESQEQKREFLMNYTIGDIMVHDKGYGILGFEDVIILAVDPNTLKVRVRSIEDYSTSQWVYGSDLITTQEAQNRRWEAAGKFLDGINKYNKE